MRTKIIAGNLVAVLVVGLVSYLVVSSQLEGKLSSELKAKIATDSALFERTWRLSGLEFLARVDELAGEDASHRVFRALDENGRRHSANQRADRVAGLFERQRREAPEVVAVTDADGRIIARNQNVNRMYGDDLRPQLRTLAGVLERGRPALDVWTFRQGQLKLLQTAIAPIRDVDGAIVGALIVGYDMSNGMASRAGQLLGREVVFFTEDAVYSSSLDGTHLAALNEVLFTQQQAATAAAIAGGEASDVWAGAIGAREFLGVTGALPLAASTQVAYAVLADRTAALATASPVTTILVMTALGLLLVLVYGFMIGTSFIKPIEQMEQGVLAVINGRTDLRLDIQSAELGGLAYGINQLLNVFTGTPEEDADGRVSSPPEAAWASDDAASTPTGAVRAPGGGGEDEDPALAAKLAEEPEDAYYARIFEEYVAAKEAQGENVSSITKERFVQRLQANEQSLLKKHGCRMVRFQVQVRGAQVNLRPVIIR